jgi:membrane-associated phospholipid phosphatase
MTSTRLGAAPLTPQPEPPEGSDISELEQREIALRRRGVLTLFALGTLLILVTVQLAGGTGLVWLDVRTHWLGLENRWTSTWIVMKIMESLGQRGPTAVEAFLVVGWIAWQRRNWRPVLLLGGSLLALNFAVGVMKIFFSRGKPAVGDPELFTGGLMFPSGHAANAVVTWAIVGYIIARYAGVRSPRAWLRGTAVVTPLVCLVVGIASVYFDSHWVSDLVAGWLIGGMVLQAVILVDQWLQPPRVEAAVDWAYAMAERLRARARGLEPI